MADIPSKHNKSSAVSSNSEHSTPDPSSPVLKSTFPKTIVLYFLISLALLGIAIYGMTGSKPVGDPYLEPCAWYRSILTRSYNCAYRNIDVLPLGPSHQLTPRDQWNNNTTDNNNNISNQLSLLRSKDTREWFIERHNNKTKIDRHYLSADRTRLGVIDTDNKVWLNQADGWKTLSTGDRGNIQGSVPFNLNAQSNSLNDISGELIRFSEDSERMALVQNEQMVVIYSTNGSSPKIEFTHPAPITDLAFSPSASHLLIGDANGSVSLWQLDNEQRTLLEKLDSSISSVDFSDSGLIVAAASSQGSVRAWSIVAETVLLLNFQSELFSPSLKVKLSNSGKKIFLFSGGEARILRNENLTEILYFGGSNSPLIFADFLEPHDRLITVSELDGIQTWDSDSGDNLSASQLVPTNDNLIDVQLSNGRYLLIRSGNSRRRELNVWDSQSNNYSLKVFPEGQNSSATLSNNGKVLISLGTFERFFQASTHTDEQTELVNLDIDVPFTDHNGSKSIFLSPDGNNLLVLRNQSQVYAFKLQYGGDSSVLPQTLSMDLGVFLTDKAMFSFDNPLEPIKSTLDLSEHTIQDMTYSESLKLHIAVGDNSAVFFAQRGCRKSQIYSCPYCHCTFKLCIS